MCSKTSDSQHNCYLHGTLRIGSQRNFNISLKKGDIFLFCKTFWKEDTLCVPLSEKEVNLIESFTVINKNQFLQEVQNNYLNVKLIQSRSNLHEEIIGVLRLPLHQFYIAYRDASLANRLKESHFPVISANKWIPVLNPKTGEQLGELECLLAIGTKKQIENMETSTNCTIKPTETAEADRNNEFHCIPLKNNKNKFCLPPYSKTTNAVDLLNIFQITSPSSSSGVNKKGSNSLFKFILEIKSARNLPLTQSCNHTTNLSWLESEKASNLQKGQEPSFYVTFQSEEYQDAIENSHKAMIYSTVVEETRSPVWDALFCVSVPVKYLLNEDERFILNVYKKSITNVSVDTNHPCHLVDALIGFATVDLCHLKNNTQLNAWINIVDFSGCINGQIHIIAKPISNITKIKEMFSGNNSEQLDTFESTLDINNTNLNKAIKRKFTELEEISERLRFRLLTVTESINVSMSNGEISDEQLEEFEHDLNTKVCEDEYENFGSQLTP